MSEGLENTPKEAVGLPQIIQIPSPIEAKSIKRDKNGRLLPGTKALPGAGNPYAKRVNEIKDALYKAANKDDIKSIIAKAYEDAKAGDRYAREWIFNRLLGRETQVIEANVNSTILSEADKQELIDKALNLTLNDKTKDIIDGEIL